MKEETREFIHWLMDNCELIKDEETEENVLWRYDSEDYSVDGLFEIYKESTSTKDILKKFMKKYKHLRKFYKTKKEFKQHLLSGEVKINIPDMIKFINK
jgi:hypothetical protein